MPILLLPLKSEQLSNHFNTQTVHLLCNHMCDQLLSCIDLPEGVSQENKMKIQVIIERVRLYLGNISRFDCNRFIQETPCIHVLVITILQKALGGNAVDTIIAQFDLTKDGMKELHPTHALTFLIVLLKECADSMRKRYPQKPQLIALVNEWYSKVDQFVRELAPIIGAPPAWAVGPNIIDPQTTVLLRLRVGGN